MISGCVSTGGLSKILLLIWTPKMVHLRFFRCLNELHPSLQFTMESEDDGQLLFIPERVRKEDKVLTTAIFWRPTFTGFNFTCGCMHFSAVQDGDVVLVGKRNKKKRGGCCVYLTCAVFLIKRALVVVEPCRAPVTKVGTVTETALRHAHCKHFQKSKHLLMSEVSWCNQTRTDLHLHRSKCTSLASRFSTPKEPFPRSEFTPGSIWTYWMLIDRQMQLILHEALQVVRWPW